MPRSADALELGKDIHALQAYRQARVGFSLRLVAASADLSEPVADALRSDASYQIAEFFFLLSGFGIQSRDEFDGVLERHNTYLSNLLHDQDKMLRLGLTKERVLAAIFDGETRPRVLRIWEEAPGTIDQSSLGRLLVSVMSDETARKVTVAWDKAGFVTREKSVYRLMLVRSRGIVEKIYGDCLREMRKAIEKPPSASTRRSSR